MDLGAMSMGKKIGVAVAALGLVLALFWAMGGLEKDDGELPKETAQQTSQASSSKKASSAASPQMEYGCAAVQGDYTCEGTCGFGGFYDVRKTSVDNSYREEKLQLKSMGGQNANYLQADFLLKSGLVSTSMRTDLHLFNKDGHTCALDCDADGETYTITCSNPQGGSCADVCKKS